MHCRVCVSFVRSVFIVKLILNYHSKYRMLTYVQNAHDKGRHYFGVVHRRTVLLTVSP